MNVKDDQSQEFSATDTNDMQEQAAAENGPPSAEQAAAADTAKVESTQEEREEQTPKEEATSPTTDTQTPAGSVTGNPLACQLDLEGLNKLLKENQPAGTKLNTIIDFMQEALAQSGSPCFRDFWEARRLCLPLFKEEILPVERSYLWGRYSELSKEARRLKDLLDEQASFAVEQIDKAISALEQELGSLDEHLEIAAPVEFSIESQALAKGMSYYKDQQRKLNFFNLLAARINSLRKELMKTEMRVRYKNKFFQRLSTAGDHIFPRRKELIKEVSEHFEKDVSSFVKEKFSQDSFSDSLFSLREEIKALQGIAKTLTLNTHCFSQTRSSLSRCWDQLREADKERKKDRAKRRQEFRDKFDTLKEQVKECAEAFQTESISCTEAHKRLDAIQESMRSQRLPREDVQQLREVLNEAKKPVLEKESAEREERERKEQERTKARLELKDTLQNEIHTALSEASAASAEALSETRDRLAEAIQNSELLRPEKQGLERELKPFRELIEQKKEEVLLALSTDDREALNSLMTILEQRNKRRQEIKTQWEHLRKSKGALSMDFAKAMEVEQALEEKREELERSEAAIAAIEEKISALKSQLQ